MGLLDDLLGGDSNNGIGGLLSYLQSPLYRTPDNSTQDFSAALKQGIGNPDGLVPMGPTPSIWDRPGINYSPAPPMQGPSPFTAGAAPIAGLPNAPVMPQSQQAAPQPPAPPPQQPQELGPINTMNIGGYQMPQFGNVADYTPQNTIPASARPTQGQIPSRPQQPEQLPPAFGGSSYLERLNNGGGLIGSLLGDTSQQKNLTAQFHAVRQTLIDSGEDARAASSKAMLAVMNPEAGKTILTEALTNKEKYGVVSEDPLAGKQYGFINERAQTVNGKPIGQGGAAPGQPSGMQGLTDKLAAMKAQGASREEMLKQIPTGYRDDVEALVTGKAVPANMGRAQIRGALNILAHAVDSNYDEQMIPTRIQMRKDFAGEGKNGQAISAFNTVQHHAGQVSDAIEEFEKAGGGSDYPLLNAGKLMLANNTGMNPKLRDASQKLQDKLNATEHEVAGAYNAGHITDSDRKTWNEIKASNLPANQLKQKLDDFVELLNGKRDSLNHMYQQTFHEDAPTIDKESNAAITARVHQRLPEYAKGNDAAQVAPQIQEGATATNPQTGQKITYRNGKWQ